MKLVFMKIESITEKEESKVISFPPGGIQFSHRGETIALNESLELEIKHNGTFINISREIEYAVYDDQSLEPVKLKGWSVISLVAHEGFYRAVCNEIKKCKVVPLKRYKAMTEQELFELEYADAFQKLLKV